MAQTVLTQKNFSDFTDGVTAPLTAKLEVERISEDFVNEFEVETILIVDWVDRHTVSTIMLGGLNSSGEVQLPVRYDDFQPTNATGQSLIVAQGVQLVDEIGPMADTTTDVNKATPKRARLRVEFRTPTWQVYTHTEGEKFVISETFDFAGEFAPLPPDGLFWDRDENSGDLNTPLTQGPGKKIAMGNYTVTIHFADFENMSIPEKLAPFIGSVNLENIFSPKFNRTFKRETLLFESPTIEEVTTPLGKHFDVTFNLTWKPNEVLTGGSGSAVGEISGVPDDEPTPQGWNLFFRPGFQDPQPIYTEFGASNNPWFKPYTPVSWGEWLPTTNV